MKSIYRLPVEFEIPVLAENEEEAAEYIKKNARNIWYDYSDILMRPSKSDFYKVTLDNLYDGDELFYNNDNDYDMEIGDYVKEHATKEEKEKHDKKMEKLLDLLSQTRKLEPEFKEVVANTKEDLFF